MDELQTKTESQTAPKPTVEQVRAGLGNLEHFIPAPLEELHAMPETRSGSEGEFKHILHYRPEAGITDGSFYVNSGVTINGVDVNLREASHHTYWNDWDRKNEYKPEPNLDVSVTTRGETPESRDTARAILQVPEAPPGYQLRSGSDGRRVTSTHPEEIHDVGSAIETLFTTPQTHLANKYVTQLAGGETIQVHVNIDGSAYRETVYYDKIKE